MKESNIDNFYEENEINENDYIKYNNFRHQEIKRIKPKNKNDKKLDNNNGNNINKNNNKNYKDKLDNKNDLKEENELLNKYENEKNKKNLHKLSKIETFFLNLFQKVTFLRENKMICQIIVLYFIFFIIFAILLIIIKDFLVEKSFRFFENKNYYSFIEKDVIRTQNILKIKIDTKNIKNMISALDDDLLFIEIYTKEMTSHGILKNNIFENLYNEETYEDELGDNFRTTISLNDLVNENINENDENNIKNLVPFYYHFVPIFSQIFEFYGLKMINFYFIGNDNNYDEENLENNLKYLYFKYPLEYNNLGIDLQPLNNKIYDYIIDPFISCNNGYIFEQNLCEIIKKNNWYYNIIKEDRNIEIPFRFLKIMKINQENKRKDYYIAYNKCNLKFNNEKVYNYLFAIRLSKVETINRFFLTDDYNDTLNYDYFSIFNFDKNIKELDLSNIGNLEKSFYEYDYNIDESKNIVLKSPKFIENINLFGMLDKKEKDSSSLRTLINSKLYSDNSIMIKYKEINDIQNYYNINFYYDSDILFYKLLYFLNQFMLYKQNNPTYLISSKNIKNEDENEHPCSISNIDEYYQTVKNKFNYDCVYDYCFFHNCDFLNELYVKKNDNYFPNCYCLPLFCKDQKTQKNSEFEKLIKENIDLENNEEFDYAYTSKYEYFISESQTPFASINNFFNRYAFDFKCQIIFNKKNIEENKTFSVNILYQKYTDYESYTMLLIFFYNNEKLRKIVNKLHYSSLNVIKYIVLGYLITFLIIASILFAYIYISCNKVIRKMKKVKNIRKAIISNANNTNININENNSSENIDENIANNENINNESNIINDISLKEKENQSNNNENNDENDNLINIKGNKNKKNKDKNESNNKKNEDELDELFQLINDNLSTFKIEFNLNEELNDNLNNIKNQYNEIIQVNKYKNKLLLKEDKEEIIFDNHNDSSISSSQNTINNKKNEKVDDLSVNIFCELLSLSNHKFDFSNIKTNFYYKENNDNSLYNLNKLLAGLYETNNNENVEITNLEKLQNALKHYSDNIHSYWKNCYDIQKAKDEI